MKNIMLIYFIHFIFKLYIVILYANKVLLTILKVYIENIRY